MKFETIPIPEILRQDVACIRVTEHTGHERLAINVCLNGLPGIVFEHHNGYSPVEIITTHVSAAVDIPTLYVYGQMTAPGVMHHKPIPFTTIQIVLKPHALQTLLGLNASALTNQLVDLTEFSAGDLPMQLLETRDLDQRINLLTGFLQNQLQRAKTRDPLIEESLRLIHKNSAAITVRDLLEHLNLSERQFEKRFSQTVGLPPQFYIRVKRFNRAIRLMQTGRFKKLTDVAHTLNFYDQSHFIRDIKAFSGITPKNLAQRVSDFHTDQRVVAYL